MKTRHTVQITLGILFLTSLAAVHAGDSWGFSIGFSNDDFAIHYRIVDVDHPRIHWHGRPGYYYSCDRYRCHYPRVHPPVVYRHHHKRFPLACGKPVYRCPAPQPFGHHRKSAYKKHHGPRPPRCTPSWGKHNSGRKEPHYSVKKESSHHGKDYGKGKGKSSSKNSHKGRRH